MVGARGFNTDYALLVTWERMGYGGAPKTTDLNMYETVKRWVSSQGTVFKTSDQILVLSGL